MKLKRPGSKVFTENVRVHGPEHPTEPERGIIKLPSSFSGLHYLREVSPPLKNAEFYSRNRSITLTFGTKHINSCLQFAYEGVYVFEYKHVASCVL